MDYDYDDRPISVYDNLNAINMPTTATTMHTSTPKAKPTTTATTRKPTTTTNGARSPYDEITFKFSDNNNKQQQQQQQLTQQQLTPQQQLQQQQQVQQPLQQLLPNGQRNLMLNPPQQQQLPNQALYSTPMKPTTAKTATATTTSLPTTTTLPPTTTITPPPASTAATAPTTATTTAPAQQRPLSQHSQSELNEASQSIAAVKAALNDAKSKFFGLNGYAQQDPTIANPLLTNSAKAQIVPSSSSSPPPPLQQKPQPKYQNIPENSAIYRHQSPTPPPTLPPKPNERQRSTSPDIINRLAATPSPISVSSPSSPSPLSGRTSYDTSPTTSSPSSSTSSPSSHLAMSSAPANNAPTPSTIYKEIPLNDLDGPQPSQAVYMSTTVPQNIKGSKIAGRHTPTRNSLRHSRMLVVNNKNYQGIQHPNPMNFKCPNLARWLLILEIVLGLLLSILAIWILCLAPNTNIQDNPYWSGLALLLSGVIGLVLVRYQRIKRHKVRENCFIFLRADSYLLSLVALLLCVVALICASIHFARVTASDTRCVSSNVLLEHGSCACTFNSPEPRITPTDTHSNGLLDGEDPNEEVEDRSYTVEYRDLSCQEVANEWIFILVASMVLNSLGCIVALLYIVLLACCRHNSKRHYSSVHTSTF